MLCSKVPPQRNHIISFLSGYVEGQSSQEKKKKKTVTVMNKHVLEATQVTRGFFDDAEV